MPNVMIYRGFDFVCMFLELGYISLQPDIDQRCSKQTRICKTLIICNLKGMFRRTPLVYLR